MPPATSVSTSTTDSSGSSFSNSSSGSFSGPHTYLTALYRDQYNNAIQQQATNYDNIVSGYNQTLRNLYGGPASGSTPATQGVYDQIASGYSGLNADVQQRIQGIDASERARIREQYAQSSGAANQRLISSGLGNSTVASAVQRGVESDRARADLALTNQTAGLSAGYAANLGGAGLAAQQQGAQQLGSLGSQYMGVLGSYRLPLPTWAPNYAASQSDSSSQSQQNSTGTSTSTSLQGTDQQQAGPPQGLNAGTPGPLYTPQGLLGLANQNQSQYSGVSNSFNYNQGNPLAGSPYTSTYYYGS